MSNSTPTRAPSLSRRRVLQSAVVVAAASGLLPKLDRLALAATPAELAGDDPDLHLLRRITFAPTPQDVAHIREIGRDAFVAEQLAATDAQVELEVELLYPGTALTMPQLFVTSGAGFSPEQLRTQLQNAFVYRAAHSKAQLFEVMVEFWNDHFHTTLRKRDVPLKVAWDRAVIRAHALGNFPDLLRATVRHAEMLQYLDNAASTADEVNENYARELMELHTLGRDGGYTDGDLKALARILTGLGFVGYDDPTESPLSHGETRFRAEVHDSSAKTFLGVHFPAGGGEAEIDRAIAILAAHPSTARHVAGKLCARFVSDQPPATLVDRVADAFRATGGDIKAMLQTIFDSSEFGSSKGAKVRRPGHALVGAVRAVGADTIDHTTAVGLFGTSLNAGQILNELKQAGHEPFGWIPPDGPPDDETYWSNTNSLLHQQRFVVKLVQYAATGALARSPLPLADNHTTIAAQLIRRDGAAPTTARQAAENMVANLLLDAMPAAAVDACAAFMAAGGDPDAASTQNQLGAQARGLAFVLLSSSWFLRR